MNLAMHADSPLQKIHVAIRAACEKTQNKRYPDLILVPEEIYDALGMTRIMGVVGIEGYFHIPVTLVRSSVKEIECYERMQTSAQ